jgi:hypothetical protein
MRLELPKQASVGGFGLSLGVPKIDVTLAASPHFFNTRALTVHSTVRAPTMVNHDKLFCEKLSLARN